MIPGTSRERLELFVRAAKFGREIDITGLCDLVEELLAVDGGLPDDDKQLLRLAMTAVAFDRELISVVCEPTELDFREAAILEAVVEYVARRTLCG